MIITPKNWMTLVALTLDDLPRPLREGVMVRPELVEPMQCGHCKRAWFFLSSNGPSCATCHAFDFPALTPLELSVERPRISIFRDERIIASAVLLRLARTVNVVVPEAADARFRARSRSTENSAEALQKSVRGVAFRALGLAVDAEGSWGWPGGERLQGGAMVPYPIELLDQLEDDAEPLGAKKTSAS